jgi:hypothetical protein
MHEKLKACGWNADDDRALPAPLGLSGPRAAVPLKPNR